VRRPEEKQKRSGAKEHVRKQSKLSGQPARFGARAVFLVGFMGAGKTSVGRALAQRLNWPFQDLDDRIVEGESRAIAEIFRDSGEDAFRKAEHAALRQVIDELRNGASRVIALGGGAFAQKRNAGLLRGTRVVFLDAPAEELWSRCCRQAADTGAERPLLQSMNQFRKLYEARRKAYLQAAVTIQTGGREVQAIADEIAGTLGLLATNRRAKGESE
jgi:shikimate kinase